MKINLYPEMNSKIADIMRVSKQPAQMYGAALIDAYRASGLEPDEIPHWIPVSERLPEADTPVICYCNNGHLQHLYQRVGYWSVDRSWHDSWDGREIPVTHWMSLPQPTKEEK